MVRLLAVVLLVECRLRIWQGGLRGLIARVTHLGLPGGQVVQQGLRVEVTTEVPTRLLFVRISSVPKDFYKESRKLKAEIIQMLYFKLYFDLSSESRSRNSNLYAKLCKL